MLSEDAGPSSPAFSPFSQTWVSSRGLSQPYLETPGIEPEAPCVQDRCFTNRLWPFAFVCLFDWLGGSRSLSRGPSFMLGSWFRKKLWLGFSQAAFIAASGQFPPLHCSPFKTAQFTLECTAISHALPSSGNYCPLPVPLISFDSPTTTWGKGAN